MSLVSEALRKARHDAAARGRLLRGDILQAAPASPARRSRLGTGFALGGFFTLAAVLVGAAVTWWAVGRHAQSTTTQAVAVLPSPAAPTPPLGQSSTPLAADDHAGQARENRPPVKESARGTADAPSAEQSRAPETSPPPADGAASTPMPMSSRAIAAAQAGADKAAPADADGATPTVPDVQTYLLRADLGYAKLQLDYLVYKASAPFGRVNGHDVVPGSIVDGFLVEEIGPDYMKLKDSRSTVILRVH